MLWLNFKISQFVDKSQFYNQSTTRSTSLIHRIIVTSSHWFETDLQANDVNNEGSWTFLLLDNDQRSLHNCNWQLSIQKYGNVQCWHQTPLPDYSLARNNSSQVPLDLVHTSTCSVIINWHTKTVFNVFSDGSGFNRPSHSNSNSQINFLREKPLVGP